MGPWLKRILTLAGAGALGAIGAAVPVVAPITGKLALVLVGWAIRHPADAPQVGAQ